jgi:hypothetical protein
MKASKRVPDNAMSRIHVATAQTERALKRLDQFMENAYEDDSCRSIFLLGEPGTGKTHLLKHWLRRRVEADPTFRAVISEVPSECSLPATLSQLLEDCGDPDPDHGTPRERTRRFRESIAELDVLVIDETQRLLKGKTATATENIATWMTNQLNRKLCPMVLAGEESAELVFGSGNDYLERRTLGPIILKPWIWEDEASRNEFRAFLHKMDQGTGLEYSGLGKPDLALRFHSYSKGRPGYVVRLISEARTVARSEARPTITVDILAEAVDRLRIGISRTLPNPFRVKNARPGGDPPPSVHDVQLPDDPLSPRRGKRAR